MHDFSGHKAFNDYYENLKNIAQQGAQHEQATRLAFQNLLNDLGKNAGWTLVLEDPLPNKKRPDGTLKDNMTIPRGYWEAKDTKDDLDKEIKNKTFLQYPLLNTIFEDTRRAVLFQNGKQSGEFDLTQPPQLTALINKFFNHTTEDVEAFHEAVSVFRERIPVLARVLKELIHKAHAENDDFRTAFGSFHAVCQNALNPQIAAGAVEEMLVQHLLSERLFRTVFENPDFLHNNVIASEIESVIGTLAGSGFQRQQFLKDLNPFYEKTEDTARHLSDWSEKQAFLNTVYERFFQDYSTQQADTMGIVYTPQPIVEWMVNSVESVLQSEFNQSLSTRDVKIVDPCTGTGNFVVKLLEKIKGADLKYKYENDIFCNEIMLLPYYIAGVNIEHAYYERMQQYKAFSNICFADTLDMNEVNLFSEENTERIKRELCAPITVIIGNPPYNVGQKNENDNNKNRKYEKLDRRIKETYAKASIATLKSQLYDPYVRFFRWASDRLGNRDGVVCFVTNNSFTYKSTFDGMRKLLALDFNQIYHLDFHGDVVVNPKLSGTTHNVFGIKVGVGVTIAIRKKGAPTFIKYHRVPEMWRATEKRAWLVGTKDLNGVEWQTLTPDAKNNWITEGLQSDFDDFLPMGTKEAKAAWGVTAKALFRTYCPGIMTGRDTVVYDFDRKQLECRTQEFIAAYNAEVTRWLAAGRPQDIDNFVNYGQIKWSEHLKAALKRGQILPVKTEDLRRSNYRPFVSQALYYNDFLIDRPGLFSRIFPTPESEQENVIICLNGVGADHRTAFASDRITDYKCGVSGNAGMQCFPFYTYAEDGSNRTENITDWALLQFRAAYGDAVSKRDIFHYVYALLHHPAYRARYAENLKKSLPRIPLLPLTPNPSPRNALRAGERGGETLTPEKTPNSPITDALNSPLPSEAVSGRGAGGEGFSAFAAIGAQLMQLHLNYETAPEYALRWVETGTPFSYRVEKMKWTADKNALIVNNSLTLEGFPPEAFAYKLGNRSALDWLVDQYQTKTDARSGLSSDPNREDDEEYIVRLIARVTHVSLETQKLIEQLPPMPNFAPPSP